MVHLNPNINYVTCKLTTSIKSKERPTANNILNG